MTTSQHAPTNGIARSVDLYGSAATGPASSVGVSDLGQADPSSSENSFDSVNQVAWAFIEQYYTTLGKNPDKLYLLYKPVSYFTCGHDGESSPCGNGIAQIQDRVKALNCKNARFRLSNIDAQPSDSSILIQVIGDFCRTQGTAMRFVQSFVLARQTNGYYVLNDIFRSLSETGIVVEEDNTYNAATHPKEETVAQGVTQAASDPPRPAEAAQITGEDVHEAEATAAVVDKAEGPHRETGSDEEPVDETSLEVPPMDQETQEVISELAQPAPSELSDDNEAAALDDTVDNPEVEQAEGSVLASSDSEDAKDEAVPTVAAAAADSTKVAEQALPVVPSVAKPAAPKTWASLAASAAGKPASATISAPRTALSTPSSAAPLPAGPSKPAVLAATRPTNGPTVAGASPAASPAADVESDGWVAVGAADSKRTRTVGQASVAEPRPEAEFRGYIKNVVASVTAADLSTILARFEVTYLDISRQKNCAFVDFRTNQGLNDAINSSPYLVGDEQVFVEERRAPRPFLPRSALPARHGRGNSSQTFRGGFTKDGPRGAFSSRGTRGGHSFRGRAQA